MRIIKQSIARLMLGALAAITFAFAAHAEVKVFRNFILVDSVKGVATPEQGMIVDNGRVRWVGPMRRLKVPERSIIEDLSGKYLIPGLIDLHVHLGAGGGAPTGASYTRASLESDLRRFAANGVTTVQASGADDDVIVDITKQRDGRPAYSRLYTEEQGASPSGENIAGSGTAPDAQSALEERVAAGLTPAQALTAATRKAAESLRAKDLGVIAPGAWADVVALDANPLADIRNTRSIHAVFIGGSRMLLLRK